MEIKSVASRLSTSRRRTQANGEVTAEEDSNFSSMPQLPLALEDTTISSDEVRRRYRQQDGLAAKINGLDCVITEFSSALGKCVYPYGRSEQMKPEHRPYYERQLAAWREERATAAAELARLNAEDPALPGGLVT